MSRGKLRELRQRVRAIRDIQETTQAMKLVSAAKLKKAQDAILRMRPFATELNRIVTSISQSLDLEELPDALLRWFHPGIGKIGIILVTSQRGLCGAFNSNLIRKAREFLHQYSQKHKLTPADFRIWGIGKKGIQGLIRAGYSPDNSWEDLLERLSFARADEMIRHLIDQFLQGAIRELFCIYAHFRNPLVQEPRVERLLPVSAEISADSRNIPTGKYRAVYLMEPPASELFASLLPWIVRMRFYAMLLEARASEHGARMTAMDKASENARQMIQEITLEMNKVRQETITREIAELVTGAEALSHSSS